VAIVPLLLDDAAGIPPIENLKLYAKMGIDLYCFSGGMEVRHGNRRHIQTRGRRTVFEDCWLPLADRKRWARRRQGGRTRKSNKHPMNRESLVSDAP
jgi:hypothetical protein